MSFEQEWALIDVDKARECIDDLDDFSRMTVGVAPTGAMNFLEEFLERVELLKRKQIKTCRILQKP